MCLSQSQHGLIALYGEHKCNMYICCIDINYIYNILHIKKHSQLNNCFFNFIPVKLLFFCQLLFFRCEGSCFNVFPVKKIFLRIKSKDWSMGGHHHQPQKCQNGYWALFLLSRLKLSIYSVFREWRICLDRFLLNKFLEADSIFN